MEINTGARIISFIEVPIEIVNRDLENIFYRKTKALSTTLKNKKFSKCVEHFENEIKIHSSTKIGDFLHYLKSTSDNRYLHFLNKYGDKSFCEFRISNYLNDKGIYCFAIDDDIKYVGRCRKSFKERINQDYGKITPANCFKNGQATNCHINNLVNTTRNLKFGVYIMTSQSDNEIIRMEKEILKSRKFDWNIQER